MFVDSSSQGVHIYKLLTDVWQTSKCGIHLYYGLGYGLPLLVVTLSILCNEALDLRGYCTALYCTVLYCTVLYCTVLYCTGTAPRTTAGWTRRQGSSGPSWGPWPPWWPSMGSSS